MMLLLALSLLVSVVNGAETTVIAVYNFSSSQYDPQCVNGSDWQYELNDLPQLNDSTQLRICESELVLSKVINFSQITNVSVVGYDFPEIVCHNDTSAGLNFVEVLNVKLMNFSMKNCGFLIEIDLDKPNVTSNNINAGINIQLCTNVDLMNMTVINSPGTGLALFYNSISVQISHSTFQSSGWDRSSGGNGVYVETRENDTTTDYNIENCNFVENVANTSKDNKISGFSRFDKGGGLCVYIRDSSSVSVAIQDCVFEGNVAAHYGGGLFGTYNGKAQNSFFRIVNCSFRLNRAKFGGANYAGFLHTRLPHYQTPLNCSHIFISNNFEDNSADFGGGTSVFSTSTDYRNLDVKCKVMFERCTWRHNSGQYGSAVTILPNAWNLYTNDYLPQLEFSDCTFDSNYIVYKDVYNNGSFTQYSKGAGAFYCSNYKIRFNNETTFTDNNGTALHLTSSVVVFGSYSTVSFTNNVGYNGGGIFLLSSILYLSYSNTVLFENNSAYDNGGAIYQHSSEMHSFDYSKTCFLDYYDDDQNVNKRNVSVNFISNTAGIGNNRTSYGHSIYASSLVPCFVRFSFSVSDLSVDIFDQVGNFTYDPPSRPMEVSTAVSKFKVSGKDNHIQFISGKQTQLPIEDYDDLNQTVQSEYLVTIVPEDLCDGCIEASQFYFNKTLVLTGEINTTAEVTLSSTNSPQIALTFTTKIEPCPPGFVQQTDEYSNPGPCICSESADEKYAGITRCNLILMQAYRSPIFWIGYNNTEIETENSLLTGHCPPGFCSNNLLLPPIANKEMLSEVVCTESRNSSLCGKCKSNLSVHYHSINFECKSEVHCELGLLFYILSELLPVTIIFLVIIICNVSFTTGMLNGFIFYAQIVEIFHTTAAISVDNNSKDHSHTMSRTLSFLYMFFNLSPFVLDELSFCLWKGANVLDILAFSYITLVYAFVLIILVIIVINKCNSWNRLRNVTDCYNLLESQREHNSLQHSIIHSLSAFLILCYAQCAHTSILLLRGENIHSKVSKKMVVLYDGDITWMSVHHLPYAIPALFMGLIINVIPPILLLAYPIHYKIFSALHIGETRCIIALCHPLERLKPFLDSFQGCFKDEYRFFSGLYFVYRFLIIAIEGDSPLLGEIMLIAMLILHALCQPYKKRLHNIIDTLLIGNLAIINVLTMYTANRKALSMQLNLSDITWIQLVLILLPLFVMGVYLIIMVPLLKCKVNFFTDVDLSESEWFERSNREVYGSTEN